jgi:hypothetical protein
MRFQRVEPKTSGPRDYFTRVPFRAYFAIVPTKPAENSNVAPLLFLTVQLI